ncbi:MAG: glycosyltransferase [Coriobacteriales bacterium]|jgi:glycosyltransferase involved in cell wall biosynthesis|nr:glycosyltransferase [Coriobacteriales bacterium]
MTPDVSIIIPVYNAQDFIENTIESVFNQTLQNIEIIVINDASIDNTPQIIERLSAADSRLKVVTYEQNNGAEYARKVGVEHAQGRYILFLDADDGLVRNACELLLAEIQKRPVDILHFGTEVEWHGEGVKHFATHMQRFVMPLNIEMQGMEITKAALERSEHSWSLWGKLLKTSLCKEAYRHIPMLRLPLGEDLLAYFFISYFSQTYRGFPDYQLYQYNYGLGGSNNQQVTLDVFEQRWLSTLRVVNCIEDFLTKRDELALYENVLKEVRAHFLDEATGAILTLLQPQQRKAGFLRVVNTWSAVEAIANLASFEWLSPHHIWIWMFADSRSTLGSQNESLIVKDPAATQYQHTAYYSFMGTNLVDRVAQFLAADFDTRADEKPLMLLEDTISSYVELPDDFEYHSIQPKYECVLAASFKNRCQAVQQLVSRHGIKRLVILDYADVLIFWDLLFFEVIGVKVENSAGEDMIAKLYTEHGLDKLIRAGSSGYDRVLVSDEDFVREKLGHKWASISYKEQALRMKNQTQEIKESNSYKLGKVLTLPVRLIKYKVFTQH